MSNAYRTACLLAIFCLVGCWTVDVNLAYEPNSSAPAAAAKPLIEMGSVTDERRNAPRALGAIRNGFGGELKSLETERPVSEVVGAAFEDALKARGLAASSGSGTHRLSIVIRKFDCSQFVRRQAHADLHIVLADRTTGKIEYEHEVFAEEVQGSRIALDTAIFASVDDLRQVANDVLQKAIDQALDDPGLRAHLA